MADAGGGRSSSYVETAAQIGDTLTSELGETLETVARGAVLRVKAPSGVKVDTLNAFDVSRLDELTTGIDIGNLVSRQAVSVVARLTFPPGPTGTTAAAVFSVSDDGSVLVLPEADVIWTYASDADNDEQRRNVAVDREVARLYAAKAREEALELNGTSKSSARCAGSTPPQTASATTPGTIQRSRRSSPSWTTGRSCTGRHLSPYAIKGEHYAHYYMSHMRQADGKARRSPEES